MRGTRVINVALAVVAALSLLVLSSTTLQAGTKSEGAFHTYHLDVVLPAEQCGGWELFVNEGEGIDTEWGPFDVNMEACFDFSGYFIGEPMLVFDVTAVMTFAKTGDTMHFTCEDFPVIFDGGVCEMVPIEGSYRCEVTEATGALEGVKGFSDWNQRTALNNCLGEGFQRDDMFWYKMHLTFPKGPKD